MFYANCFISSFQKFCFLFQQHEILEKAHSFQMEIEQIWIPTWAYSVLIYWTFVTLSDFLLVIIFFHETYYQIKLIN